MDIKEIATTNKAGFVVCRRWILVSQFRVLADRDALSEIVTTTCK